MAMKLKKKAENVENEVIEEAEVQEQTVEDVSVEEAQEGVALDYPEQLNGDEKDALEKTAPEDNKGEVSTVKMESVLDLVSDEFNLTGKRYTMQQYKDGGSKVTLSLANEDYDITVTVKDVYTKVPML